MRILYFSDLHIEVRQQNAGDQPWTATLPLGFGPDLSRFAGEIDLVILAGDIGRLHSRRNVGPLSYADQAAEFLGCRAVLVPGNHEYYRGAFAEDRAALLAASTPRVTVLDRGEWILNSGPTRLRVLGATLWTDYAVTGDPAAAMHAAGQNILDHSLILRRTGGSHFLPADALAEHRLSRAWLAERLAEPHSGPTIVVSHHVPHSSVAHPGHGLGELAPAFCSDCDDLLASAGSAGVRAWIFGHHHWCVTAERQGVKLLSAQPGYPGEETGWTGPGCLEI